MRVLGVPVGTITTVEPQGTQVRVEMRVDRRRAQAPGRRAAPSSSRRAWSPTATSSSPRPTRAARSWPTAPSSRSSAPPSRSGWTSSRAAPTELSKALGPDGVNANGALSDAARRRGGEPGRQRPDAQRHDPQPGRAVGRRWRTRARTCSPPSPSCRSSPPCSPTTTTQVRRVQRQARRRLGLPRRRAGRPRRRRCGAVDRPRRGGRLRAATTGREIKSNVDKLTDVTEVLVEAAEGAGRDPRRRPRWPVQPRQHLQRLVGHPRHPRRHQRAVTAADRADLPGAQARHARRPAADPLRHLLPARTRAVRGRAAAEPRRRCSTPCSPASCRPCRGWRYRRTRRRRTRAVAGDGPGGRSDSVRS